MTTEPIRDYVVRVLPNYELDAQYKHASRCVMASHEDAERFTEAEAYAGAREHRARFPRGRRRCMVEHVDRPGPALSWDDYEEEIFDTPGPWPRATPDAAQVPLPKQVELFARAGQARDCAVSMEEPG